MNDPLGKPAPTFAGGVRGFARGVGFVLGTPATWPAAAVPIIVWVLLSSSVVGALGVWFYRSMQGNITWTQGIERVLGLVLGVLCALLVATALAQPLSGPALDVLVERRRAALGLGAGPRLPFRQTFPRSLGVALFGLAASLPVLAALWLLGTVVPVVAPVALLLKFIVVSLVVAWDFLDYPFTVEGMRFGERIAFIRANFGLVLGFGMASALVLLVPCVGLLVLPMGVVGATDVLFFGRATESRYPPTP